MCSHEVLAEVDDNGVLIICDPQRILGQQLKPRLIHYLNINIIFIN
jgi:hypothetical protein